jgi:hypothetical protein
MASKDEPPEVLSSLPAARPQRPSARRDAARAKRNATPGTAAKGQATGGPTTASEAAPRPKAGAPRRASPATPIPPGGYAARHEDQGTGLGGADLAGTAVQAAGELVQIGIAFGGQALKSALGRLGVR